MLAIMALPSTGLGADSRLERLDLDPWETGARAVMTLSDSTRVRHFYLGEGAQKLVLDFYDTVHALRRWNHPELVEGPVTGVRTSQYRPHPNARSRVVFDLSEPCSYAVATSGNRTTVTLAPVRGARSDEIPLAVEVTAPSTVDSPAPIEPKVAPPARPAAAHVARLRGVSARALAEALAELGIEASFDEGGPPIHGDVEAGDGSGFRDALLGLIEGG